MKLFHVSSYFAARFVHSLLFLFFFTTTVKTKILLTLKGETFSEHRVNCQQFYIVIKVKSFFSDSCLLFWGYTLHCFNWDLDCLPYVLCTFFVHQNPTPFDNQGSWGKKKKFCIFCFGLQLVSLGCARLSFPKLIMNMNNSENIYCWTLIIMQQKWQGTEKILNRCFTGCNWIQCSLNFNYKATKDY